MIRVALLSTIGNNCGTSVHADRLVQHVRDPHIQIDLIQQTIGQFVYFENWRAYDIVHINESGWINQGSQNEVIGKLTARGLKTLLTMSNPIPTNNRNPWTTQFTKVAVFEPHTTDGFDWVPIPAPVYKLFGQTRQKIIGTNGFPQARKNLDALAEACEILGYKLMSFQPESQHADTHAAAHRIQMLNPGAMVQTKWVSDQEMLDYLSICTATCYPYLEWMPGSSSAAMYGVSARGPVVVSRCSQFNTMFDYEDEIYFIESERPTIVDIVKGLQKVIESSDRKIPHKLYERHNWDRVAERYVELYKGMMK